MMQWKQTVKSRPTMGPEGQACQEEGASHGVALVDEPLENGQQDGSCEDGEAGSDNSGDPRGLSV